MDYGKILARAFEITFKYRVLWLFGFLMALFGESSGGNYNFGNWDGSVGRNFPSTGRGGDVLPTLPPDFWQNLTLIIVLVCCVIVVLAILSIVVRFLSRAALIGLVQELETNGTIPTIRRGFSIGADRFWPQLGIAITINLPLMIITLVLILIAIAPILTAILPLINAGKSTPSELGTTAAASIASSVVMICCAGLCLLIIYLVVQPFYQFILRACIIGKRGVMDSIREGYRLVRENLGNVIILYLLIIGTSIGFALLMIPIALILIGIPIGAGIAIGFASQSWQAALILGGCLFIPLVLVLIFISGLFRVFESAIWTEGYLAVTTSPSSTV